MYNVACPLCGQTVQGNPQLAGHVVTCPGCQQQFEMPGYNPHPQFSQPLADPFQNQRKPSSFDFKTIIIAAGITCAVLLLAATGVAVAIALGTSGSDSDNSVAAGGGGWLGGKQSSDDGGSSAAKQQDLFDHSQPLPELDELIGRPFSATHPDAEARMAEAEQRGITRIRSGDRARIGDIEVTNDPIADYGGFVFGLSQDNRDGKDGQLMLVTDSGTEPLRVPRSFSGDKTAVEQFLKRHHGAANVKIERVTEQPYYLAHLAVQSAPELRPIRHGRSRQEIQQELDDENDLSDGDRLSIRKLERVGSVIQVVYRLHNGTNEVRSDEAFLVLNGKVVYRYHSDRSAILFD